MPEEKIIAIHCQKGTAQAVNADVESHNESRKMAIIFRLTRHLAESRE